MLYSLDLDTEYKNKFESLSIKKNNLGNYVLYGLLWYELKIDGILTKVLCSIKSNNLSWKYNFNYTQNTEWLNVKSGRGNILHNFLQSRTVEMLYNFTLTNINDYGTIFEITILNGKKDEYMNYTIYEGLESYTVKINVAGIKKDEITVLLEEGIINVKTNPKQQEIPNDVDIMIEDFKPIKSECEIYLPNILSIEAELKDGVLTLTAPKESKGIKIEIK